MSARFHVWILLALGLLGAANAPGGLVLFDDAHDSDGDELVGADLTTLVGLLAGQGITLHELDGSPCAITPSVLAGYDALFIHDAELSFTPAEIAAITAFVASGGGLFVTGNAPANFNQATYNALLAPFGIQFHEAISPQDTVLFADHPLVAGLTRITGDGVGRLSVSGDAILLGFNALGQGTIALRPPIGGAGPVLVMGDGAPLLNGFIGQYDNAAWVTRAFSHVVPEPSAAAMLLAGLLIFRRLRPASL